MLTWENNINWAWGVRLISSLRANTSLYLLPYHLISFFILMTNQNLTYIDGQHLMKETNINIHIFHRLILRHTKPLLLHVKRFTKNWPDLPPAEPLVNMLKSTWKRDMKRCLHQVEWLHCTLKCTQKVTQPSDTCTTWSC